MGVTIEIQTILIVLIITFALIYLIMMKLNKKFAGLSIIVMAFTLFALPEKVPLISEYIYGSILILFAIGAYVLMYGVVNRE